VVKNAMYIGVCILPLATQRTNRKKFIEHGMCFDFLYNLCLKKFSFYKEFIDIFS